MHEVTPCCKCAAAAVVPGLQALAYRSQSKGCQGLYKQETAFPSTALRPSPPSPPAGQPPCSLPRAKLPGCMDLERAGSSILGFDLGAVQQKEGDSFLLASANSTVQCCRLLIVLNIQICRAHTDGLKRDLTRRGCIQTPRTVPFEALWAAFDCTGVPSCCTFSSTDLWSCPL